jgi:P27 family predicted phage terminase small subunit
MSRPAKAIFRQILRTQAPGIICRPDVYPVRLLAEAVERYVQAQKLYTASGPLVRRDGNLVKNPLHQIIRDNADEIVRLCRELGLSPSARVGFRIEPGQAEAAADGLPPRRLRAVGDGD